MANLRDLEYKFSRNYREAFEDIATLMFCTEIGLTEGVNRRTNQRAMESDPVFKDGKLYAFQAKYYDAQTKLPKKKKDLIESIEGAAAESVTDFLLFVNQNLPDKNHKTGRKPKWLREIEESANACNITLQWWSLSKIESSLDMPKFSYIRDRYLASDTVGESIAEFYEESVRIIEETPESDVYGRISLKDGYIEPYIKADGNIISVKDFLEKWVTGDKPIIIIHGEPGHGKTSMCWKAMYDAYKSGWMSGLVNNVFIFSLNPVHTSSLDNNCFSLSDLLSWGFERQNKVDIKLCKKALIFLDAFDELVECAQTISLIELLSKIQAFQKITKSHIVITSRTMALPLLPNDEERIPTESCEIPTYKLQPISNANQIKWIEKYQGDCPLEVNGHLYIDDFKRSFLEEGYKTLLGIPIIFRMIVSAKYLPSSTENITDIYDNLFDITWKRNPHPMGTKELVFQALCRHALTVYLDNTETAKIDKSIEFPWVFSFYTNRHKATNDGASDIKRVGFLHNSFYQYFLAHEIFSWYEEYEYNPDGKRFMEKLAYLAKRRLDGTTLLYLRQLWYRNREKNEKHLKSALVKSYEILKNTDGILALPGKDSTYIDTVTPLCRANFIFGNVISIGSICGEVVTRDNINEECLVLYNLSACNLMNARLEGAFICRAVYVAAILLKADFKRAKLQGVEFGLADLTDAILSEAELSQADFRNAVLKKANLSQANLKGADFRNADLSGANLSHANLSQADFRNADLSGANLSHANLSQADFRNANLSETNLSYAIFSGTRMDGAILSGADLSWTVLYETDGITERHDASILDNTKIDLRTAGHLKACGFDVSKAVIISEKDASDSETCQ